MLQPHCGQVHKHSKQLTTGMNTIASYLLVVMVIRAHVRLHLCSILVLLVACLQAIGALLHEGAYSRGKPQAQATRQCSMQPLLAVDYMPAQREGAATRWQHVTQGVKHVNAVHSCCGLRCKKPVPTPLILCFKPRLEQAICAGWPQTRHISQQTAIHCLPQWSGHDVRPTWQ